jgi:hypothetical protein
MLDRPFDWALRHGPRLLFVWSALILLLGAAEALEIAAKFKVPDTFTMPGLLSKPAVVLANLIDTLYRAALPLFGALVVGQLERRRQEPGSVAALPASPSRLLRYGVVLLLALSLLLLGVAAWGTVQAFSQASPARGSIFMFQKVWLEVLWQGSVLLTAALALDRVERWLATVRPYSD